MKAGELLEKTPKILIPEKTIFKKGDKWAFVYEGITYTAPLDKKFALEKVLQKGVLPGGKVMKKLDNMANIIQKASLKPEEKEELENEMKEILDSMSSNKKNIYDKKHVRVPIQLTHKYSEFSSMFLKR